jgi:Cytochrome C'
MPVLAAQLLVAGCGQMGGPPHAGQPTEQARSMQQMLADVQQIRAFVYGSGDRGDAERAANDLVSWSGRMAELFPPGLASTDYVDMSPERVNRAPAAMRGTTERLLAAVGIGSRATIAERLAQVEQDGCGTCHLNRP